MTTLFGQGRGARDHSSYSTRYQIPLTANLMQRRLGDFEGNAIATDIYE